MHDVLAKYLLVPRAPEAISEPYVKIILSPGIKVVSDVAKVHCSTLSKDVTSIVISAVIDDKYVDFAVIFTVPLDTPVTRPVDETVAIALSLLVHSIPVSVVFSGVNVALNCVVFPI